MSNKITAKQLIDIVKRDILTKDKENRLILKEFYSKTDKKNEPRKNQHSN